MAVYERTWKPYSGPLTPVRSRFLVVTRYAIADAFASRLFTAFYAICFLPSLVGLFFIYLSHNVTLLEKLGMPMDLMNALTSQFFMVLFGWQALPAFLVALIVSPSLISADLANGALPLYLGRPIDRPDYVLGKAAVLAILLSPMTWVMGLTIFGLQAYLEGGSWWIDNYRIALAYLVGHLTWIVVISMLTLAISAWVRFKPAARGALFGIIFILAGFGTAVNGVTRTSWGDLFNLVRSINSVVLSLFGAPTPSGLPVVFNWLTLITVTLLSIGLLNRKLRAHEVIT
ncbi:MAG: ABC transporter permease subunit [Acidobacteriota bacterium]|nr:ABC transporter permease subunit [Acidobacteriota bacterium]